MVETTLESGDVSAPVTEVETPAAVVAPDEVAGSEPAADGAPAVAGTLLDGAGDDAGNSEDGKGEWPEDWRVKMAGGDEKLAKRLARYTSPITAMKAGLSAQDRIRSGDVKAPLPEDANDEQVAAWRKENGIPVKPDEYKLPEIKGYDWSDADQEMAKGFFEQVHGKNYSQEQADAALGWYTDLMAETHQKQYEADSQAKAALEDDLRLDMGPEYRGNIKMLARYVESIPGVGPGILEARLPDGSRLGDNKEFVSDLIERARDHYGDSSFVAGDGGQTTEDRKAEIQKIMNTDFPRYRAEKLDVELRGILQKEEKRGNI